MLLTHPFAGWYRRRDGRLGTYRVWHRPLELTTGSVTRADIRLFERLGLVPRDEQTTPHSVLLQRATEFAIELPPRVLRPAP